VTADELPDRVLQATFERTRAIRQRRGLSGWRLFKMIRINRSMFAVGAAAIVLLAIVGVALLPRLGSLMGSGEPTGQIAFERTVNGNTDIYLLNLDGSGLVRLTDDSLPDHSPAWTPDGKTLVFERQISPDEASDIYSLDVATKALVQLTNLPGVEGGPKVSPDGRFVAYDQWPTEPGTHVMGIDGSNPRLLFTPPDDTYVLVGWTTDGTGLYSVRSGVEVFLTDVATGTTAPIFHGGDENMTLSPDGSLFAFQGDKAATPSGVYLMNVDGSNVRHIVGSWTDGGPITWSPDGKYVAFFLDGWINVIGVDGSGPDQFTEAGTGVAWRPQP